MKPSNHIFVVVAHQDDWQIFFGHTLYHYVRDPQKNIVIVVITAGDAGDSGAHWKSRLSGAVISIARALPSWSPYALDERPSAELPSSFQIAYRHSMIEGKNILSCEIQGTLSATISLKFLHLPDGGVSGYGFSPNFASLLHLKTESQPLQTLWPEHKPSTYTTWEELQHTVGKIIDDELPTTDTNAPIYAADPDPIVNPDDHIDHRLTSELVAQLIKTRPNLIPHWHAMYCIASKAKNLAPEDERLQRTAIFAYGAGYSATAAGFGEKWRTGWEREYLAFSGRYYPTNRTDESKPE